MIHQSFTEVLFEPDEALIYDAYTGFKQDYLILHSLLRRHKPFSICEVGTNTGEGVNVMATALPNAEIFSLDLDFETMKENSKQYPIGTEGEDRVGSAARFPYTQLRGDSKKFNFRGYCCDAYWIDGEHDSIHPFIETMEVLTCEPKIIIYHDFDIEAVELGVQTALRYSPFADRYQLFRVDGTRIAYLLRKNEMKAAA